MREGRSTVHKPVTPGRFDEASQKDVLALAARLQREHFETMSAAEIETAAAEAGLGEEFVREAIRRVAESPELQPEPERATTSEIAVAIGVPATVFLVFLLKYLSSHGGQGGAAVLALILIVCGLVAAVAFGAKSLMTGQMPVSLAQPTVLTKRQIPKVSIGSLAIFALAALDILSIPFGESNSRGPEAILFLLALAPFLGGTQRTYRNAFWTAALSSTLGLVIVALSSASRGFYGEMSSAGVLAVMAATGLVFGLTGMIGFAVKRWIVPTPAVSQDRSEMLRQLFELQAALESHRQHRAFLSVDVVGSTAMKVGSDELQIEHSFREYQAWVGETIRAFGGEVQLAAGDGAMAMFVEPGSAVAAARRLQDTISDFNAVRSRLSTPFRIRCGISEGRVGIDERTPLGHLQSPVVDQAAALQKIAQPGAVVVSKDMIAAAMPVLESLKQIETPGGDVAYSWP